MNFKLCGCVLKWSCKSPLGKNFCLASLGHESNIIIVLQVKLWWTDESLHHIQLCVLGGRIFERSSQERCDIVISYNSSSFSGSQTESFSPYSRRGVVDRRMHPFLRWILSFGYALQAQTHWRSALRAPHSTGWRFCPRAWLHDSASTISSFPLRPHPLRRV